MDIKNYTAKDVMREAVMIDSERTVAHAGVLMDRTKSACLCVTRNGHIDGLFKKSEIDLLNDKDIVGDVMEPCRMSVISRSDLSFVLRLIEQENLHSVLVMENGKCVGIITRDSLCEDGFIQ